MNIRALKAKKAEHVQAARAVCDNAEKEGRAELSADEQAKFDQHMAASKQLDAQIANLEALANAEAGLGTAADVNATKVIETKENRADDPKRGFKSFGEFASAVKRGSGPGANVDERLRFGAAAPSSYGSEGVGADGGFLIPTAFASAIWRLSLAEDSLLPMTDNTEITGNAMAFPQEDESNTPWGTAGVRAYWQGEATQATATKPKLSLAQLRLNKLMALVPITDELADDAPALTGYLTDKMATSIRWKTNEAIFKGSGAGQPQGVMNANAIVEVAKESGQAANTVDPKNLMKMIARLIPGSYARSNWFIGPDVLPQIFGLTLGNYPIYLPAGAAQGGLVSNPYGMLLGRPIIVSQHAEALSSAGDIQLHDLSYYRTITKAGGIQTASSMHLYFDYDMQAFRSTFRVDGGPKIKAAIAQAKGSNTLSPFVRLGAR